MANVTETSPPLSPVVSSRRQPAIPADLPPIEQHVEVAFRYRVLFTEDVFAAENPLLAQTLAEHQTGSPTRFLCVVEQGVASATPGLIENVRQYARRYREFVDLVATPLIVPGGERVKNDPAQVDNVLA